MKHENGVTWYTEGTATIPVFFPEDIVTCANCRYVARRYGLRYECILTDEILLYPSDGRGNICPVRFEEAEDECI